MKISSLLVALLIVTPVHAEEKKWANIYHWCANAAPEYLFDASFDEWMDACLDGRVKNKKKR